MDNLYEKFSSTRNLELAWMRLKTGQNNQYKKYYRTLFLAYELTEKENIKRLSERLRGGSYRPSSILRFYQPKPSGLQRPITLLHLDDLIVYQAMANVIADKFNERKKDVEFKNVFSNVLNRNKETKIFFFKRWQEGYGKFIKYIKEYYNDGNIWVAHFDLAAHYDTIDHRALAEQISKKAYIDFTHLLKKCLEEWSTHKSDKLNHGIPQGPMASNLLAEIHILPIDIRLDKNNIKYARYSDDIKIFGKTKREVLSGVILLDEECKERGLIPQSKKYEVVKATCVEDAIGKFPSLAGEEKNIIFSNLEESYQLFIKAFDKRNFNISRVKYILKVSNKNEKILPIVLENMNNYPELADEFFQFLSNYIGDLEVGRNIYRLGIENSSLYKYVEGKYWELLSYFPFKDSEQQPIVEKAIERLKTSKNKYALKRGIYIFLCSVNTCLVLKWLNKESSSLTQMMIVPYIPEDCLDKEDFKILLKTFFRRSNYEPAIVTIKDLIYHLKFEALADLKSPQKDESGVINNLLGHPEEIDSIGQIIKKRYEIEYYNKWKKKLESDYNHANNIISLADNAYYIDRNTWVNYTDTFNDIIIRKFISLLYVNNPIIKWPKIKNNNGGNIDYGVLLDPQNQLSKQFPNIVDGFYLLHKRRTETPVSHAYIKKTAKHTDIVTSKEQRELHKKLKISYDELIKELKHLI